MRKLRPLQSIDPGLSESLRRVDDGIEIIWALENRANRQKSSKGKQSVVMTTTSKSRKSRLWLILSVCFFLQLMLVGAGLFYTDNLNFMPIKQYNSRPVTQYDLSKPSELPSSSFQVNNKSGETEASRKSSPELEQEVTKDLAGADSEQARSTTPSNQQQKNSATIFPDQTTSSKTFYTVQKNDTLGLISQKVYDTSSQWPTIANANKDQLGDNPNRLNVGMILIIPTIDEASKTLWWVFL